MNFELEPFCEIFQNGKIGILGVLPPKRGKEGAGGNQNGGRTTRSWEDSCIQVSSKSVNAKG